MSSPFGVFLRDLRLRNNFRQHELAAQLGYEQAYISALELGTRGPTKELIDALVANMSLSEKDLCALSKAVEESGRRFVLPVDVPTDTYRFCHELWDKIGSLHPAVIQAMRELSSGTGDAGMGSVVQSCQAARTHRLYPARRS